MSNELVAQLSPLGSFPIGTRAPFVPFQFAHRCSFALYKLLEKRGCKKVVGTGVTSLNYQLYCFFNPVTTILQPFSERFISQHLRTAHSQRTGCKKKTKKAKNRSPSMLLSAILQFTEYSELVTVASVRKAYSITREVVKPPRERFNRPQFHNLAQSEV